VHNYLQAHLFGNATAEDFWSAQTAASGKPVDKIMTSFVSQAGVPVLEFGAPGGGKVGVSQQRFFLSPTAAQQHASDPAEVWTVPVCLKGGATTDCPLLGTAKGSLPAPASTPFFANARARGYYRARYPEAVQKELVAQVESLTAPERIDLLGDTWASVRSGHGKIGESLELAAGTSNDASSQVLSTVQTQLSAVSARVIATAEERRAFEAWVRQTWKPALTAIGPVKPGETPEVFKRRIELFSIVGLLGKDPAVIEEAKGITNRFLVDPNSVDPNLGPIAMEIAAQNGDAALFDRLQQLFETSHDPQVSERGLNLLAQFEDPKLMTRAMEYATSGKVKNQDSLFLLTGELGKPETRDAAWQYITTHWQGVSGQLTEMNGGGIVGAAGSFCSAEKAAEVKEFYTAHPVHASARALTRAEAAIQDCMAFRSAQEANLKSWLAAHGQ
jgi:aminopeptidase N/puromycin-sensitive aminopeptidase